MNQLDLLEVKNFILPLIKKAGQLLLADFEKIEIHFFTRLKLIIK